MKKILAVSVLAMMAVPAANATIASKAYVTPEKGTYVSASNTTGANLKALDARVVLNEGAIDTLNGNGETSVSGKIAAKVGDISPYANVKAAVDAASTSAGGALQTVSSSGSGVVTGIAADGTTVNVTLEKITKDEIANDAAIARTQLVSDVQTSLGKADTALQSGDIKQSWSDAGANDAVSGAAVATYISSLDLDGNYANKGHTHDSADVNAMTGYTKASSAAAIGTSDSLNVAVGKLEYKADAAADTLSTVQALDNTSINNAIAAMDNTTGNTDAGVVTNVTQANGVITVTKAQVANAHVDDNAAIATAKLADGVQTTLALAATALQPTNVVTPKGTSIFTKKVVGDVITYNWEAIE